MTGAVEYRIGEFGTTMTETAKDMSDARDKAREIMREGDVALVLIFTAKDGLSQGSSQFDCGEVA